MDCFFFPLSYSCMKAELSWLTFWQADIDKSGTIDYGEFIAATLHMNKMEKEENLIAAFSFFDKDGSGYLTIDELQQACRDFGLADINMDEMIKEIDQDNVSHSGYVILSFLKSFCLLFILAYMALLTASVSQFPRTIKDWEVMVLDIKLSTNCISYGFGFS